MKIVKKKNWNLGISGHFLWFSFTLQQDHQCCPLQKCAAFYTNAQVCLCIFWQLCWNWKKEHSVWTRCVMNRNEWEWRETAVSDIYISAMIMPTVSPFCSILIRFNTLFVTEAIVESILLNSLIVLKRVNKLNLWKTDTRSHMLIPIDYCIWHIPPLQHFLCYFEHDSSGGYRETSIVSEKQKK